MKSVVFTIELSGELSVSDYRDLQTEILTLLETYPALSMASEQEFIDEVRAGEADTPQLGITTSGPVPQDLDILGEPRTTESIDTLLTAGDACELLMRSTGVRTYVKLATDILHLPPAIVAEWVHEKYTGLPHGAFRTILVNALKKHCGLERAVIVPPISSEEEVLQFTPQQAVKSLLGMTPYDEGGMALLAKDLGVTASCISNWSLGKNRPTGDRLPELQKLVREKLQDPSLVVRV